MTKEKVQKLASENIGVAEIARRLGISKSTVSYHMSTLGYEKFHRTNSQIEIVKNLYKEGKTMKEIANELNLGYSTVKRQLKSEPRKQKIGGNSVMRRIHKVKKMLVDEFGGKCSKCGYDKYIGALEFHHLDPKEKEFNIASRNTRSYEKLREEAEKCILVCSNCHKEIHAGL